ncbi:MAG: hypothetical protein WBG71_11450 [Leeuwenhoekiella sp.]
MIFSKLTSVWGNSPIEDISFPEAEILNEYTARIPFQLVDHLIVVEAGLLNQTGKFIIDTGAETFILNSVHFSGPLKSQSDKSSGILGSVETRGKRRLQEFILKNFSIRNTTSDVIDLSHIEKQKKIKLLGIIGHSILKDHEVFVDLHLNQITLTKTDRYGNRLDPRGYLETISDSVPFKLRKHTITLEAFVQDFPVTFGLDTGAEVNHLNKRLSRKLRKYFSVLEKTTLVGASGESTDVLAGNLFRVKLNDSIYFGPMRTLIANLGAMEAAFGVRLDGILGYEFFAQKRTIINYQKEMLYFIDYPKIIKREPDPPK